MSPEKKRDFESEWPHLARRLRSFLARKKVPVTKQDDLIQETALRLYKMWDSVDRNRPAWALTVTIALNLLRDEYRRAPHSDVATDLPDIAQNYDVERAGLARIELGRVKAALAEMSPAHRLVLLAEVGQGSNLVDAGDKMRRMRARRKLTEILERVSAIFVLPARRIADMAQAVVGIREGLFAGVSCVLCTFLGIGVAVIVPVTAGRAGASTLQSSSPGRGSAVAARSILVDGTTSTQVADTPGSVTNVRSSKRSTARGSDSTAADGSEPLVTLPIQAGGGEDPVAIPIPGQGGDSEEPVPVPDPEPPALPILGEGGSGDDAGLVPDLKGLLGK